MSSSLPIVKLVSLVIRQLGQPLANRIKNRAKKNLFFRTYVCMPPAQIYHWMEINVKRKIFNFNHHEKQKPIEKLNEKAAIELGAELLGESIIFLTAVLAITLEFMRQQRKAIRESDALEARWINTAEKMTTLEGQIKESQENLVRIIKLIEAQDRSKLQALIPILEDFNRKK